MQTEAALRKWSSGPGLELPAKLDGAIVVTDVRNAARIPWDLTLGCARGAR